MYVVPVGQNRTATPMHPVRNLKQMQTYLDLMNLPGFDYFIAFAFSPEVGDYCGPFNALWYTTDDQLHLARIHANGRIAYAVSTR